MKELDALTERLTKKNETKIRLLSSQPANLGMFTILPLNEQEIGALQSLLTENRVDAADISEDLNALKKITSEVKAIHVQAIILHGERIKKAREILMRYREGAFSLWLIQSYGNRQTPYNFLQFYEFYQMLTESLREKMMEMPKQAVYALASRAGELEKKEMFIREYSGESKENLLLKIRQNFPLASNDKRKTNFSDKVLTVLTRLLQECKGVTWHPSKCESQKIHALLQEFRKYL